MRNLLPVLTILLATSVASQLVVLKDIRPVVAVEPGAQSPFMPLEDMPAPSGDLLISDSIGKERIIAIFASFTRDIAVISSRLDSSSHNTTVLAPINAELKKLEHKPWEDPQEYAVRGSSAYEGESGVDRAQANLRRFVEAHVDAASPWAEGEKAKTLQGRTVWWEAKDGKKVVRLTPDRVVGTKRQ